MGGDVDLPCRKNMCISHIQSAQFRRVGPQGRTGGWVKHIRNAVGANRQGARVQIGANQPNAKLMHLIRCHWCPARFADNADKVPIGDAPRQGNIRDNLPRQKGVTVPSTLQHHPIGQAIAARSCVIQLLPFGQGQLAHGDLIRRCRKSGQD